MKNVKLTKEDWAKLLEKSRAYSKAHPDNRPTARIADYTQAVVQDPGTLGTGAAFSGAFYYDKGIYSDDEN